MTPLQYYLIGTYFAGILIIIRGFNEEYQESIRELKEKAPSEAFFSNLMLVVYIFLILFSWVTVAGFTLKRAKEWFDG